MTFLRRTKAVHPYGCRIALLILSILTASCEGSVAPVDATVNIEAVTSTAPQVTFVNTAVAARSSVRVSDATGRPLPGARVMFAATRGGGRVTEASSLTDADGIATSGVWTVGRRPGPQEMIAFVANATTGARVTFLADAQVAPPTVLILTPEAAQITVGDSVQLAWVRQDQFNNIVPSPTLPVFTALAPTVASVSASGRVRGLAPGVARIVASIGPLVDTVSVTVTPPPALAPFDSIAVNNPTLAVAISASGLTYVVSWGIPSELFVIDRGARTARTSLVLPSSVYDVTFLPNGTQAYLAGNAAPEVYVVDVASTALIATITVPSVVQRILASASGDAVYAALENGQLLKIDVVTRTWTSITLGGVLNGIARHPTLPRLYVSSTSGSVHDVSLATFTLARSVSVGGVPHGLDVDPTGTSILVARQDSAVVQLSTASLNTVGTIPSMTGTYDIRYSPDGTRLVVTQIGSAVFVLDATTRAIVVQSTGYSPLRSAMDPVRGEAIVTGLGGKLMVVRY
jgi:DNA-binding beta-propeller fold protein YncE